MVTRNAPTVGWDVTGGAGATGDGVKIQLWSYGGGTNQQWKPVVHADGSYSFTPRNNTACALTSPTARRPTAPCSSNGRAPGYEPGVHAQPAELTGTRWWDPAGQ